MLRCACCEREREDQWHSQHISFTVYSRVFYTCDDRAQMSRSCLWFIVHACVALLSVVHARFIHLPAVNISELAPIGTSIAQLSDALPFSNWLFTFLSRPSIIGYFLLDDVKGTITVKRPLDREDLCRLNVCSCSSPCLLKADIHAISDTETHILSLPILIVDENDNHCYFTNELYHLKLSESIRLNARIVLPVANDPDLSPNNVHSYFFSANNYSEFRLENHLTPSMTVVEKLDRESRDHYDFDFCASEGPDRSCCTKLTLTITDVNDNAPQFQHDQQLPLTIQVSEYLPIGAQLIQMQASDRDTGLNGQIKYSFSKWTMSDRSIYGTFDLHPDNGSIRLLKQLDYEQRNNYELQIQAKDRGPNSLSTYATVIVQVNVDEKTSHALLSPL